MAQLLALDRIAGVVLAGGRGSRMGGADKALLMLRGRPLVAHVIGRLGIARVISANGDPARFAAFGLPVLADDRPGFPGPLAGVLAGLDWAAAQGFAGIVTAAADTPFFPCDLPQRLAEGLGDATVAMASGASLPGEPPARQPTFALWRTSAAAAVRAALDAGQHRPGAVAGPLGCVTVHVPGDAPFFNINTPADLARAECMAPDGATP